MYLGGDNPNEVENRRIEAISGATRGIVSADAIRSLMPNKEIGASMLYCAVRFEVLGTTLESAKCFQNVSEKIRSSGDQGIASKTMYYVSRHYAGDQSALATLEGMVSQYRQSNPQIANNIRAIINSIKGNVFIQTITDGVSANIKNAIASEDGFKSAVKLWEYNQAQTSKP
jgi:DNA-binding transcriptional regulator YdaS (Cro superfamily)